MAEGRIWPASAILGKELRMKEYIDGIEAKQKLDNLIGHIAMFILIVVMFLANVL